MLLVYLQEREELAPNEYSCEVKPAREGQINRNSTACYQPARRTSGRKRLAALYPIQSPGVVGEKFGGWEGRGGKQAG